MFALPKTIINKGTLCSAKSNISYLQKGLVQQWMRSYAEHVVPKVKSNQT